MTVLRSVAVLAALAVALAGCLGGGDAPPTGATPTGGPPVPATGCDAPGSPEPALGTPGEPTATLATSMGTIVIALAREQAPVTVSNFVNLSKKGFYDGTKFHRVIGPAAQPPDGFMIQGGDPNSKDANAADDGRGGPGYKIPDEFHPALRHDRLVISMANSGPNTGGSQFFITMGAPRYLDDKHAVFGRVVQGQNVVSAIGSVETNENDRPLTDVVLQTVTIAEPASNASATHGVKAHVVVGAKKTEAGRPVSFALVATNTGNVRDAISAGASAPEGWSCKVDAPTQIVPAGAARVFIVTLTPPAGAASADVVLKAWSRTDPAASADATARVEVGTLGAEAKSGSKVKGNYAGMLIDGRLFDTSMESVAKNPAMGKSAFWGTDAQHRYSPFDFTVGQGVITGFSKLATGAKEGEIRLGRIPPAEAYGASGQELSGKTLIFELEIVDVS